MHLQHKKVSTIRCTREKDEIVCERAWKREREGEREKKEAF